jgi:hypothetical protein
MLLLAASEQAGNDERAGTQKVVATRTFRTPIRKLSGIGHVRSHGQVLGESSATRKLWQKSRWVLVNALTGEVPLRHF